MRFVNHSFQDNIIRISSHSGAVPLHEPCETYPNLAPGRYVLVVEADGYEPLREEVDVRAGETIPVTLHLRAR